jgi:hypothetical protein
VDHRTKHLSSGFVLESSISVCVSVSVRSIDLTHHWLAVPVEPVLLSFLGPGLGFYGYCGGLVANEARPPMMWTKKVALLGALGVIVNIKCPRIYTIAN